LSSCGVHHSPLYARWNLYETKPNDLAHIPVDLVIKAIAVLNAVARVDGSGPGNKTSDNDQSITHSTSAFH
jgi:hypothetical protein